MKRIYQKLVGGEHEFGTYVQQPDSSTLDTPLFRTTDHDAGVQRMEDMGFDVSAFRRPPIRVPSRALTIAELAAIRARQPSAAS